MGLYKFEPLKNPVTIWFSDSSRLRLPKGTYYVGYDLSDEALNVYVRIKPGDVGLGNKQFNPSVRRELEERVREISSARYRP